MFRIVTTLGPIDAKSTVRDPLLKWMMFAPLALAVLIRLIVPLAATILQARLQFDLTPYYRLIMSSVLLLVPILFGTLIGFLLLDQRDDHTLTALQVTPLTLTGYLIYRITLPLLLSLISTVIAAYIIHLEPIRFGTALLASLLSAPLAPMLALFFGAFAQNKVQGFALSKGSGVFVMLPVAAYFTPLPWQWAIGLIPTYWPAKLYWMMQAGEPHVWLAALVGLSYQGVLLFILTRRFNQVMSQ